MRLAALATKELTLADADVTRISLADYPLPIYDADLEAQVRPAGQCASSSSSCWRRISGVFIASPEYNASITPLLKNTIDWISRGARARRAAARRVPEPRVRDRRRVATAATARCAR